MWRGKPKPSAKKLDDVMYPDITPGWRSPGMLSDGDVGALGRAEAVAARVRVLKHLLVKVG